MNDRDAQLLQLQSDILSLKRRARSEGVDDMNARLAVVEMRATSLEQVQHDRTTLDDQREQRLLQRLDSIEVGAHEAATRQAAVGRTERALRLQTWALVVMGGLEAATLCYAMFGQ